MLSKEDVKGIALLARIGVSEADVEKYEKDLSTVLDFFGELEKLPTDGVEPIGHITGRADVARSDSAESSSVSDCTLLLDNVPETKDGFVKVKSVF